MMATDLLSISQTHPARSRKLFWYQQSFGEKLTVEARRLFEDYSKIPPSEVDSHIYQIRDLAWDIFPFPCIGGFWFIIFGLSRHPHYQRLLSLLTASSPPSAQLPTFLDLGTCLGQDLRALHRDGVPLSSLYGSDIFPAFEAAGHALFKDADRFTSDHFIAGDIFNTDPASSLAKTMGSWSAVNIMMFLHLFDMADQERVCAQILKLLRPVSGSFVIGAQSGTTSPGELVVKPPLCEPGEHKTVWRHSRETMVEMWERVGEMAGLKLNVWAEYDEEEIRERERGLDQDQNWEKRNRYFVGKEERRIFFLAELV